MNEGVDVFAEEAKVDDESERAAEALTMLKVCVGTGVHHKSFREAGLGKTGLFTGFGQAASHVGTEGTFAVVLHGGIPRFR